MKIEYNTEHVRVWRRTAGSTTTTLMTKQNQNRLPHVKLPVNKEGPGCDAFHVSVLSPAVLTSVQGHTEQDSRRQPGTNHMNDSRNPPPVPVRDLDRSKGKEGGQLTSTSPVISPASSQVWTAAFITPQSIIRSSKWRCHASCQGSGGWEKVFDEVSGRPYYFNRSTRTTSWNLPEPSSPSPPPGSASHRKHEGGPVRPSLRRWPGWKSEHDSSL